MADPVLQIDPQDNFGTLTPDLHNMADVLDKGGCLPLPNFDRDTPISQKIF